jgi:hypothetical protein
MLPKGKGPEEAREKRPVSFSLFFSLPACGLDGSPLFTPLPGTNQTDLVAVAALLENVAGGELLPVPHLIRRQDAAAAAERADAVEGGEDGRANKLGPVGHALHGLGESGIDLKGDDRFLGGLHENIITLYYQLVKPPVE